MKATLIAVAFFAVATVRADTDWIAAAAQTNAQAEDILNSAVTHESTTTTVVTPDLNDGFIAHSTSSQGETSTSVITPNINGGYIIHTTDGQ